MIYQQNDFTDKSFCHKFPNGIHRNAIMKTAPTYKPHHLHRLDQLKGVAWFIVLGITSIFAPILVILFNWVFSKLSGEKYGDFLVSSNVDSARVFLNKDFKGLTDSRKAVKFESLQPGIYVLSVEMTGFTPFVEESVRIAAGEISSIKVDLKINEAKRDSSPPVATENNKKMKITLTGKTGPHRIELKRPETVVTPETYEVNLEFPSSMTKALVFVDGVPALPSNEKVYRHSAARSDKDC